MTVNNKPTKARNKTMRITKRHTRDLLQSDERLWLPTLVAREKIKMRNGAGGGGRELRVERVCFGRPACFGAI